MSRKIPVQLLTFFFLQAYIYILVSPLITFNCLWPFPFEILQLLQFGSYLWYEKLKHSITLKASIYLNMMFSFFDVFYIKIFFFISSIVAFACLSCCCRSDTLFWSSRQEGQWGSDSCSPRGHFCPWMPTGRA